MYFFAAGSLLVLTNLYISGIFSSGGGGGEERRGQLSDKIVAGVAAPLLFGATVLLPLRDTYKISSNNHLGHARRQ